MNIRSIYVLAAAIAIVSCGGNSTTTLKGKFAADEIPSEVHITVAGIDTVITVADGTFTLKVPVSKGELGMVESDAGRLQFISDGSELLVDYSGERPRVTSDNPKSLTRAFNAYVDKSVSLVNQVVGEDDASTRAYDSYMSLQKKTIAEHKNDFIGLYALQNVYFDYTPEELKKVISTLGPEIRDAEFVKIIAEAADARINTAEGKMFTDFEVDGVKFSDYVGRGKYVLAVFWSSWCIPYRAEVPVLMDVYEKFHGDDFDIVGIAVWDEDVQASKDAVVDYETPWDQIFGAERIPTNIYGIQNIPHIILFAPDGTILKRDLRGDAIADEVSKVVPAKQ